MRILLDTNVISEFRKSGNADRNVMAWAAGLRDEDVFLSVISVFEIELGARRIARRDERQAAMLRRWIDHQILARFSGRILPFDVSVALRCAELHVPDPRRERDALIAATALVHGMVLATRNVADFRRTNVPIINPWDEPSAPT